MRANEQIFRLKEMLDHLSSSDMIIGLIFYNSENQLFKSHRDYI